MKIIHQVHPQDFENYKTQQIREKFLLEKLVQAGKIECCYTHYDRMIIGAANPVNECLELTSYEQLKSENFLDRREMGIISIAGKGSIKVDGEKFELEKLDCLYIGMGKKEVTFCTTDKADPAKFIFFSCPAHQSYPPRLMKPDEALPAEMGGPSTINHRVIN